MWIGGEGEVTLEVWIGVEDVLWRQAQTEVEAESTEGTVTSVLEFSAFDEPVVIEPPEQEALLVNTLSILSDPFPGEPIAVAFVVENLSDARLDTTVDVLVDGETVRTFTVADLAPGASRVPGSGVRGRGSGERETTASSLAGKEESSRKEDNSGQGKDGPAGAIAQGGNGR